MKKLDNKGMSLVETVVAILIISMASVLLLESLSAVTNIISNANTRDLATNQQLASLVGGVTNANITVSTKPKETVIMVEGSSLPITVTGEYTVTSGIDKNVSLQNFVAMDKDTDIYKEILEEQLQGIYKETKDMTVSQKNAYLATLEQETGIVTGLTCLTGIRNDELRVFYYLKYGHSEIKTEIIEECNKIYDTMHPNPGVNTHEAKAKIGERKMYLKPYFIGNSNEFVLCGGFLDSLDREAWRTNLIYDEVDKCFYYKIFPASNNMDAESYYSLTKITSLAELRTELRGSGWQKITVK